MTKIAKATTTAVAVPYDYGQHAGVGLDLTLDDLLIPFIGLLQDMSPQVKKSDEGYVPGAEAGMIINKANKQLSKELLLVPAERRRTFIEFLPNRGGFVANHEPSSPVVQRALASGAKRNELKTETGNTLVETFSLFAIQVDEKLNPVGYVVIPFSSTKIRAWREYFTLLDTAKVTRSAPLYAHVAKLGTKATKNTKGSFFIYDMKPAKGGVVDSLIPPDHPAFQAAAALREAIVSGRAQADFSTEKPDSGEEDGGGHF